MDLPTLSISTREVFPRLLPKETAPTESHRMVVAEDADHRVLTWYDQRMDEFVFRFEYKDAPTLNGCTVWLRNEAGAELYSVGLPDSFFELKSAWFEELAGRDCTLEFQPDAV